MFPLFFAASSDKPEVLPADPDAPRPEGEEEEEESVKEAMAAALSAKLVGWGVSILMHAGLVLLAAFLVWSYIEKVQDDEVIIPIARLSEMPGTPMTQTEMQRQEQSSASQRRNITRTQTPQSTVQSKVTAQNTLIGLAGGAASKASPIGTAVGAGQDVGVGFYGTGGNARRIAYVVDASGSLMDTLPFVILELKRSIAELSEQQSFTVLFFQAGLDGKPRVIEGPTRGLKPATAQNKQAVINWIDPTAGNVVPTGKTNPMAAIRQALTYRPQLLFLLSDNITGGGIYELDQRLLVSEIKKANRDNTKINTIQFLVADPLASVPGMRGTLQLIAEETGGIFKFVDARELGLSIR
jgi:hypothetical protein